MPDRSALRPIRISVVGDAEVGRRSRRRWRRGRSRRRRWCSVRIRACRARRWCRGALRLVSRCVGGVGCVGGVVVATACRGNEGERHERHDPLGQFSHGFPLCLGLGGAGCRRPTSVVSHRRVSPMGPVTSVMVTDRRELVTERPPLPVVADLDPDAVQTERFEDQEHDDQHAVQHEVPVEHVERRTRAPGCRPRRARSRRRARR